MKLVNSLSIFISLIIIGFSAQSQTIAQWRGINSEGIYNETNLLKTWPESGPKLLWETVELGFGYGSPVISGDKLFVNGEIDSVSHLFAFNLQGKLLWKSPNGKEFMGEGFSAGFPGARSTPTVYGNLVYVCSGLGRVACFEIETGKEIWTTDMIRDFGGQLNYFGYSESLLVDEKFTYCYPGGAESNIVALDRFSGKVVWTSKAMNDPVSFGSPMLINLPEMKIFVTLSHNYLIGLNAQNGELLWSFKEDSVKLEGDYCNTPIYSNGFIYGVSGIEKGTGAYKLELSTDGKTIKEIWRNNRVKNAMGGIIKIDNNLYTSSEDKKLKCLDINTGAVIDSIKNMRGIIIAADNQLYCYADNGNVNLISLNNSKMEQVSKFKIEKGDKEHFAHPVINNGVLYIRHGKALMAYEIK